MRARDRKAISDVNAGVVWATHTRSFNVVGERVMGNEGDGTSILSSED